MRVSCVVDDAVQRSSPFWGEHGIAFLIETEGRRVLFDTGQSGTVLLRNLKLLDVDPATMDAVVISHAHYDHTGSLSVLLKHLCPGTPLYANPDLFRERFSRREGQLKSVGLSLCREEVAARLVLELSWVPQEIIPGLWTSGEIVERPEPQGGSDYHFVRESDALVADAYGDDMALVLQTGGEIRAFEEGGWDGFYKEFPAAGSNWKGGLMMPNILKEVEHIILMPRCARHVLAGATLGLKAAVGYWRTDTHLEYHRDASTFHEKTAESNTVDTLFKKQRLVLTAADKILATFGPDEGRVCQPKTGLVIASESVAAHDTVSLAWLIENRRAMPPVAKKSFRDSSRLLAGFANRVVVGLLSDWKTALASETLTKNALDSIWDDRVLNRTYQVFGGRPEIALEAANDLVPHDLQKRLTEMATPLSD